MALRSRDAVKAIAVAKDQKALQKRLMVWMLFSVLCLVFVFQSVSFADEDADNNLYAKNYKEQNAYHLKSLNPNPNTEIFVSNHKEEDNVSMLENGYDMMGSTGFTASDVPANLALEFGQSIKADRVLVYTKYASAKAQHARADFLRAKAKKEGKVIDEKMIEEAVVYDYYASYWAKIPMPKFGVHIVKLQTVITDPGTDEVEKKEVKGLKILAVIKESPAALANVLKGDDLLKIGDVDINKPDDLFAAVGQYVGQTVPVVVQRGQEKLTLQVKMNS